MSDQIFYSPPEAAKEIWGQYGHREKHKMYRYLQHEVFKPIEEQSGFKILKSGNRYLIPGGLVKAIKEQAG